MKTNYPLSCTDEYADIPAGWYGDTTKYQPLVDKARRAMKDAAVDLVEIFWAGEADGEGFIEPYSESSPCMVMLACADNGADWYFKSDGDYADNWQGPHFRMCMEDSATLYWNAKHHDAEITLDFQVQAA